MPVTHQPELPIHAALADILGALTHRHELVLEAPPGAGKTTIVPLALLGQPWQHKRILLLEPRRMAARTAAQRMADLLGEPVGQGVGYRIRQDTKVSTATRIEVVTGGVLTRLLQDDPGLSEYSAVIFDEFHERNLDTDLGLALTLQGRALLRDEDDPLKIIVMSATLDGAAIAALLNDAPVVRSQGRMFPVDIAHLGGPARKDPAWLDHLRDGVLHAAARHQGSILVFLPGQREILGLQQALSGRLAADTQIAPLYGNLSLDQQQMAINPPCSPWRRKVVLATDIAETSLTIEGVEVVVDSGLRREPVFDPRTGMTRLQTVRISQASATQRAGRAGRLGPGFCYRLWRTDETLAPFAKAEIEQADLAPVALQMLGFGVADPASLSWLTPPPAAAFAQALALLEILTAIQRTETDVRLTTHGQQMAAFPAHPRLAHMMLRAAAMGLADKACTMAAALEETGRPGYLGTDVTRWLDSLHNPPKDKGLASWAQRARQQMRQYRQMLSPTTQSPPLVTTPVGLLLALAYPDRIARQRHQGRPFYQLGNGRGAALDEADPLARQTWLAVAEVGGLAGRGDDRIFAAAELDANLFADVLSEAVTEEKVLEWDDDQQRFVAERRRKIGAIVWQREPLSDVSTADKQAALAQFIRRRGLHLFPWEEHHRQWQARVELLRRHLGESAGLPWPEVDDTELLNNLEDWLTPYLLPVRKLDDLRRLDLSAALSALLPWPLPQKLDEWAPTHIQVPSGSRIAIDYGQNPPVLAVKLQEMFGCETTPTVAQGRVPLQIHLLSPARRPLQVTQDLAGFWRTSYHEVKKEMKGRYPKHPWPDDPLQASATRFTKNRSGS